MDIVQTPISPYVRRVHFKKTTALSGEWVDFDHVFTYIEQGEADFIIAGTKYAVSEGDIILMQPFAHHIINSTSDVPLIQYIFHFDFYQTDAEGGGRKETGVAEKETPLSGLDPIVRLPRAERPELVKYFLKLQNEYTERRRGSEWMLKALATLLIALFVRHQAPEGSHQGSKAKSWPIIKRCIDYIHANCHDPELSNLAISQACQISISHLFAIFKEQVGVSLHKYVNHVRIERAKKLIVAGGLSMTEIAGQTGFSGLHHFSKAFKQTTGITASSYKNR